MMAISPFGKLQSVLLMGFSLTIPLLLMLFYEESMTKSCLVTRVCFPNQVIDFCTSHSVTLAFLSDSLLKCPACLACYFRQMAMS